MSDEKPPIPPQTPSRLSERKTKSSVDSNTDWRNPGTPKGGEESDEEKLREREEFFRDFKPEDFKPL